MRDNFEEKSVFSFAVIQCVSPSLAIGQSSITSSGTGGGGVYQFGDNLIYECNTGYQISEGIESVTYTCQSNKMFSSGGLPPNCTS